MESKIKKTISLKESIVDLSNAIFKRDSLHVSLEKLNEWEFEEFIRYEYRASFSNNVSRRYLIDVSTNKLNCTIFLSDRFRWDGNILEYQKKEEFPPITLFYDKNLKLWILHHLLMLKSVLEAL